MRTLLLIFAAFHLPIHVAGLLVVSRRPLLTTVGTLLVPGSNSTNLITSTSSQDTITTTSTCGDVLVPEVAIPGAYQSACMDRPVRVFPVSGSETLTSTGTIQIHQGERVGAGSTGSAVWNSSILLYRLVQKMNPTWKNASVVELGCGAGLVSRVLALPSCGARSVLATDGNPEVIARLMDSIVSTSTTKSLEYSATLGSTMSSHTDNNILSAQVLQWGESCDMPGDAATGPPIAADWVVGSDLTYNPNSWPALAKTMAEVAQYRILYLTLAHSGFSSRAELDGFLTVAAARENLQVDVGYTQQVRRLLRDQCIYTEEELSIVQEGGGAEVVVLQHRL